MGKGARLGLILVVLLLIVAVGVALIWGVVWLGKPKVPAATILEADFHGGVLEYTPPGDPILQLLSEDTPTTLSVVEALTRAAEDDKVKGLIARVGSPSMGIAQLEEVRAAVKAFRTTGKPAIAYADTFGEFGPGNSGYYLATAFDEIWIQPSGDVGLTGLLLEGQFLKGTFEKLDMDPQMDHRYEYKNAMNTYTESEFTEAHEEALRAIMDSIFDTMVSEIADARGLSEERVRELFDSGPHYGAEAVEAGLVDGLAYRDQIYQQARETISPDDADGTDLLYLSKYRSRAGSPFQEGETVALIYGVGAVTRGSSEFNPLFGQTMGSDTVAKAFRDAIADDDVRAILFRVDSPGGSYVGSDTIWREVVRAREAGKPVIVTMGNVAGSGGYFVAMAADKIIAQPSTITGSIGVLAGKVQDRGFWDKLGISFDHVQSSEASTHFYSHTDYTDQQWQRFQAWLDRVYEDFTTKVADGRDLPKETVLEVAKGRIWSGSDALELGLVDGLGGFSLALTEVRAAAGWEADAPVRLKAFPRPMTPFEAFTAEGPESSEPAQAMIRTLLHTTRPALELARRVGLVEEPPAPLAMPGMEMVH